MTNNQLTRERIELIANFHRAMMLPPSHDEIEELARMALAAMDSEPVAYMTYKGYLLHAGDPKLAEYSEPMPLYADPRPASTPAAPVAWDYEWASCITCEGPQNFNRVIEREAPPEWAVDEGQARNIIPLYRHAQPAPERDQVRREHAEWSQVTFGNVGPIGPLKHLSKEALEAAAEPGDLSEWADMQFLLWDAQRRAGITDEQITQAMIEKLVVNKQRSWPEPKEGYPRLHIKEQPAPVVQDNRVITQHFDTIALETAREILCDVNRRHEFLGGEVQLLSRFQCRIDEACRAAMLQEPQKSAGE
ncbi:Eaa1 [Raoultella terrigena]|nr:Eaa1 [Raoultella terrigena]